MFDFVGGHVPERVDEFAFLDAFVGITNGVADGLDLANAELVDGFARLHSRCRGRRGAK